MEVTLAMLVSLRTEETNKTSALCLSATLIGNNFTLEQMRNYRARTLVAQQIQRLPAHQAASGSIHASSGNLFSLKSGSITIFFMLNWLEHEKSFMTSGHVLEDIYKQ